MATGLESFEIYQLSKRLEIYCHKILRKFPKEALYSVRQLQRSSSSVSDNIAEGYSRFTYKEKRNKFIISRAEAAETKEGFKRACEKDYVPKVVSDRIDEKYTDLIKMINGYIRFLNKRLKEES